MTKTKDELAETRELVQDELRGVQAGFEARAEQLHAQQTKLRRREADGDREAGVALAAVGRALSEVQTNAEATRQGADHLESQLRAVEER